jgi:predicted  nucleic acid-binding Zn-ribbon protein
MKKNLNKLQQEANQLSQEVKQTDQRVNSLTKNISESLNPYGQFSKKPKKQSKVVSKSVTSQPQEKMDAESKSEILSTPADLRGNTTVSDD